MYPRFGLVLMVTRDCNLRCTYCYAAAGSHLPMPEHIARKAIDRAVASVEPGGTLELGFFGGEPLLEAELVLAMADYARFRAAPRDLALALNLTTNGTVTTPEAWTAMTLPDMDLAVSHDGLPDVHDLCRRRHDGSATSCRVLRTIHRLLDEGARFRVVMVVCPDNIESLPAGVAFLHGLGVPRVEPVLDLWACWTRQDVPRLERAVADCAAIWRCGLPHFGISWFEEKFARLVGERLDATARCGFGAGEVAVAPSGNLYPCARLIGDDAPENPMRLPGHVLDGDDFLSLPGPPCAPAGPCRGCAVASLCSVTCRCGNFVRTGDASRPDGLLCAFNRACLRETVRVTRELAVRGVIDVFAEFGGGFPDGVPAEEALHP
jgi:uncharacterized protein